MDLQEIYDCAYTEYHTEPADLSKAKALFQRITAAYSNTSADDLSAQNLKILASSYVYLEYIAFFENDDWNEESLCADRAELLFEVYLKQYPNDADALDEYLSSMLLVLRYDKMYDVLTAMLTHNPGSACRKVLLKYMTMGPLRGHDYITADEEEAYKQELLKLTTEPQMPGQNLV